MTDREKIETGRRYAIGDGVCVDHERAYMLWKDVRFQLSHEDSALFSVIEEVIYEAYNHAYREKNAFSFAMTVPYAQTLAKPHTEAEVRTLFERLLTAAAKMGNYEPLYKTLLKLDEPQIKEKTKKPENKRFGNNLMFLLHQFGWTTAYFREKLNVSLMQAGLKEKSLQAIYQVIGGVNGMNESGQIKTAELFNESDRKRGLMTRPLTVSDLHLPLSEMTALFYHPKLDERLEKLLKEDSSTL